MSIRRCGRSCARPWSMRSLRQTRNHWVRSLIEQWSRRTDLQPEALAMTGLAMLEVHDPRATQVASAARFQRPTARAIWSPGRARTFRCSTASRATIPRPRPTRCGCWRRSIPSNAAAAPARRNGSCSRGTAASGGIRPSRPRWCSSAWSTIWQLRSELESDFTVRCARQRTRVPAERHFTAADALSGASLTIDVDAAQLAARRN